jgi:hypothetical protein
MSNQTLSYLVEMEKVYKLIMKKYVDTGELNSTEMMFLEVYKRTISNT